MWLRIFTLTIKEFLALFKDKKSRMVIILPPLMELIVFGYAATFDLNNVPFAVYNQDRSNASQELIARFDGSPNFRRIATIQHHSEIRPLIDARRALIIIHIPSDFSRRLLRHETADVQLIVDGRNSNTAMLSLNYVRGIIDNFNRDWSQTHHLPGPPAQLVMRAWYNSNLVSRWFIVPGVVGLLTLVVTMLVTSLSVAREREQGTFDQLLVTPLRPVEILIGKALPGLIIGTVEASFIVLLSVIWFHIPLIGHLATLYTGIGLFLLSGVGVGLMISSLSVTMQQGLLGAFLFMVPAIILSGFATPIDNMPKFVQLITLLDPARYYMVVLRGVFLEGTPFHLLISQFWPMAVIGMTTLSLAGWLFRRRMY